MGGRHGGVGVGCLGELEGAGVVGGPWAGAREVDRGEGRAVGQGGALGGVRGEAAGAGAPAGLPGYPWASGTAGLQEGVQGVGLRVGRAASLEDLEVVLTEGGL